MDKYTGVEVAIIGISGQFPGAADTNEFWENLKNGVESISFFTDEELLEEGEPESGLNDPLYVKANAYLQDKDCFDAAFFGYRNDEAKLMDPQMRLFHEHCWKAIEDAGYDVRSNTDKIGLFAGATPNVNWELYSIISNMDGQVDDYTASQLRAVSFLCSRVSYLLNLQGPSVYLNTACSTSLVAVQRACMSLLLRECNMALAGGTTVFNHSKKGYRYQEGMIASADGHCRAFDAGANGTVAGEGVGVVLLKRLEDAVRAGDHIYAVIRGSAVNNDGNSKMSFTAPSVNGQYKAIAKALNMARVAPQTISYIEAHGTATALGDPIEVEALRQAYGTGSKKTCALGTVKTNIGHLDVAAGVAGLIKTVLSLKHRKIPPTLHFTTPNAAINFSASPFYVNTELTDWKNGLHPLRAAVSSFGIGGTNVHLVLEEAPAPVPASKSREFQLLPVSGKTAAALKRNCDNLRQYLRNNPQTDLANIAYTLQVGRTTFPYRKAVICRNAEQAIAGLEEMTADRNLLPVNDKVNKKLVFMFPGQGSQQVNMFWNLYNREPFFKNEVDRCLEIAAASLDHDLRSIVFTANTGHTALQLSRTEYAQPLLFIMEYALAKLLMHWGLMPDTLIGHSIGEYVAACISGVFSLEDAIWLVGQRGAIMQKADAGTMLSISITEEKLQPLLKIHTGLSLASVNSTELCVVSGARQAIDDFSQVVEAMGCHTRLLHTSHAFHSYMMDPILAEFEKAVQHITINPPKIPVISNLTGLPVTFQQLAQPRYWVDHLRNTVRFSDGIEGLLTDKNFVFLEVGPGNVLSSLVKANKRKQKEHVVISVGTNNSDEEKDGYYLLGAIGALWTAGIKPSWTAFYEHETRQRVPLPTYSFEKDRFVTNIDAFKILAGMASTAGAAKNKMPDWLYTPSWKLLPPLQNRSGKMNSTCTLLLTDSEGIGEALREKLEADRVTVVQVSAAQAFQKRPGNRYSILPGNRDAVHELYADLTRNNILPDTVVHAWGIGPQTGIDFSEANAATYFYSLLHLIKEGSYHHAPLKQVIAITSDLHDVLRNEYPVPLKALPIGLLKVVSQEHATLRIKHIDLVQTDQLSRRAVNDLYNEMLSEETGKIISLRDGRRWQQTFEQVLPQNAETQQVFREGGVYLITGGLGALGYRIAKALLQHYKATVIITGRTPVDAQGADAAEKIKRLRLLEQEQGTVRYFTCNGTDAAALNRVVTSVESAFGKIHGVIHAAGIVKGSSVAPLEELDDHHFKEQFAPKIAGFHALLEVFGDKELDFCLLTSSLATVLGGLGFSAYASANIYLDYAVQAYRKLNLLQNWISVSFDGFNFENQGNDGIAASEIMQLLTVVVSHTYLPHIVVSVSNLQERIDRWVFKQGKNDNFNPNDNKIDDAQASVTVGETINQLPAGDTSAKMLHLWQNFFGRPSITMEDDFFELGGDSLKALTIINRIHKSFQIDLSVREFFGHPTVSSLSQFIGSTKLKALTYRPILPVAEQEHYALSSAQRRLYFLYEFDKLSMAYHMPQLVRITGELDMVHLQNTFNRLLQRHESLRTAFLLINDRPVQQIVDDATVEITSLQSTEEELPALIKKFMRPFDFARPPLLRVGLIQLSGYDHVLMIDIHHIITDGISNGILMKDFMALYEGRELPPLHLQYKDYAEWQQGKEAQVSAGEQKAFWMNQFPDAPPLLELPVDFTRPAIKTYKGGAVAFDISEVQTEKLKALAAQQGVTEFMLLLAIYNVLLSKLSCSEDIVVGTPAAGREHADLENIIGMFINMLPLRNAPQSTSRFNDFLVELKANCLACFAHQSYPYENLIEDLQINRNTARNPLFDAVFSFENFEEATFQLPGLTVRSYPRTHAIAKFDFTLLAMQDGNRYAFFFEYSTDLFQQETINRFVQVFKLIVDQVLENPAIQLADIQTIDMAEKEYLLQVMNNTSVVFPNDITVVDVFEDRVSKHPDAIALTYNGATISYRQLNEKANRLSHFLIRQGVQPDTVVAILLDRSMDMIVAILAIIKAGGAYLPIDIESPEQRIRLYLQDCQSNLLISTTALAKPMNLPATILYVDEFVGRPEDEHNPRVRINADQLLYILYTSGTTGKPKGVMVDHANLMSIFFNEHFRFNFNEKDVWTMFHRYCFDFSVWEMYGALLFGGKLVLVSKEDSLDPSAFLQLLQQHQVTVLNQTPTAFNNLVRHEESEMVPSLALRYVIFGGEALHPKMLSKWYARYPHVKLVNMFGITETTIHVTYKEIGKEEIVSNNSNIGIPLPAVAAFVLDPQLNLRPMGFEGELYVGGAGLARGYINNPELTYRKFIADPYAAGKRLYKSGDLVRMNLNGELEYKARIDNQVQLKGFRIELGEIEHVLTKYRFVKDAKVLYQERGGESYLIAYYVADHDIEAKQLRRIISEQLPLYMVPAWFVRIETMPLTVNGKVDISQLPQPQWQVNKNYEAPQTGTQKIMTGIWEQVLGVSAIALGDNYFTLGGDSIMAIRLVAAINKQFELKIKIVDLYNHQTIRELAAFVESIQQENTYELIDEVEQELEAFNARYITEDATGLIEQVLPMSSIEKGMCYVHLTNPKDVLYYEQLVWFVPYKNFNITLLEKAMTLLVQKHSTLRVAYDLTRFAHIVYRQVAIHIPSIDISGLSKEEQVIRIQTDMATSRKDHFLLHEAPLWKMRTYRAGANNHVVIFEIHHAISDGWSIATFKNELNNTYASLLVDEAYVPPVLKSGYCDFIKEELLYRKQQHHLDFWRNELAGFKKYSFGVHNKEKQYRSVRKVLSADLYKRLEETALSNHCNVQVLFFAACMYSLKMMTYENDIVAGLVTFNRLFGEDATQVFGNFLNTVPVRLVFDKEVSAGELLQMVIRKLTEIRRYDKTSLFEINMAIGDNQHGDNPVTDILFNFTNFHSSYELSLEKVDKNDTDHLGINNYIRGHSLFDVNVNGEKGEAYVQYEYATSFIEDWQFELFNDYYFKLLNFFAEADTDTPILPALSVTMPFYDRLNAFNATETTCSTSNSVVSVFLETVKRVPHKTAVIAGSDQLTYAQLHRLSDLLAARILERVPGKGSIVGIVAERSTNLMVAILAILKAQCVYLPLDPGNPVARNDYMLQDASVALLLTQPQFITAYNGMYTVIDIESPECYVETTGTVLPLPDPDAPMYVIYTSGSTGRPKGVLVSHKAVWNRLNWMQQAYPLCEDDVILQKTSVAFDVSVWELFWWMYSGAQLVMLPPGGEKQPALIRKTITEYGITTIHFVPTMLAAFMDNIMTEGDGEPLPLRLVFASGEALPLRLVKTFRHLRDMQHARLINLYGPTEATVDVTHFDCSAHPGHITVPIGKPIDNIKIHILDSNGSLLPIGIPGELCIEGTGVALGYLNKPELTREKFIGKRSPGAGTIYKTGDSARWLPDGHIEYLGRIDNQVKIRGNRIEPGEVEQVFCSLPGITGAVVIAAEQQDQIILVAFYIATQMWVTADIKNELRNRLPEYMIPTRLIQVETVPVTSNGKADKKALLTLLQRQENVRHVPEPRTELEKAVAGIWIEELGVEDVGIEDRFLNIGNSMSVIKTAMRMKDRFGVEPDFTDFFDNNFQQFVAKYEAKLSQTGMIHSS